MVSARGAKEGRSRKGCKKELDGGAEGNNS
jgi:hypothetical protein